MTPRGERGAPLLWPRIRSRVLRPLVRSSSPTPARESARPPKTAVEMTRLWKSQNDFHSRLEISHRTRDSHIPTAAFLMSIRTKTKTRTRYAPCHAPKEVLDSRPAVGHANRTRSGEGTTQRGKVLKN